MARRKKKVEEVEEVVETTEEVVETKEEPVKEEETLVEASIDVSDQVIPPYPNLWQNVTWYIKVSGKNVTWGDLERLRLDDFEAYKNYIDEL